MKYKFRPDYPTEYDLPEPDETLPTVRDFCDWYGIEPLGAVLRAIDKYNATAVSLRIQGTEPDDWIGPNNWHKKPCSMDDPIEEFLVTGIAWDGSDWEFGRHVDARLCLKGIEQAQADFEDALHEHYFEMGEEHEPMD